MLIVNLVNINKIFAKFANCIPFIGVRSYILQNTFGSGFLANNYLFHLVRTFGVLKPHTVFPHTTVNLT